MNAFRAGLTDPSLPPPPGLTDGLGQPAGRRYDVYRNNVTLSLAEVMETAFPVIRRIVGSDFFRQTALVFVRAHPPTDPRMMYYGAAFPDFLREFAPVRTLPFLPAVARLEQAVRRSYHAADAMAVDPGALATVPGPALPGVRFSFAPAVELVRARVAVASIWTMNQPGATPAPMPRTPEWALVSRPMFDPIVTALTPEEGALVRALMEGQTLGAAMALAAEGTDIGRILGLLLAQGCVTQLETT
jgi:hypothetical protein